MKDATGQAFAYIYARESKPDADTAELLTMDEPRRVATKSAETQGRMNFC